MDAFEFSELVNQQGQSGERYLEFLAVPAMSLGVYSLPAGRDILHRVGPVHDER